MPKVNQKNRPKINGITDTRRMELFGICKLFFKDIYEVSEQNLDRPNIHERLNGENLRQFNKDLKKIENLLQKNFKDADPEEIYIISFALALMGNHFNLHKDSFGYNDTIKINLKNTKNFLKTNSDSGVDVVIFPFLRHNVLLPVRGKLSDVIQQSEYFYHPNRARLEAILNIAIGQYEHGKVRKEEGARAEHSGSKLDYTRYHALDEIFQVIYDANDSRNSGFKEEDLNNDVNPEKQNKLTENAVRLVRCEEFINDYSKLTPIILEVKKNAGNFETLLNDDSLLQIVYNLIDNQARKKDKNGSVSKEKKQEVVVDFLYNILCVGVFGEPENFEELRGDETPFEYKKNAITSRLNNHQLNNINDKNSIKKYLAGLHESDSGISKKINVIKRFLEEIKSERLEKESNKKKATELIKRIEDHCLPCEEQKVELPLGLRNDEPPKQPSKAHLNRPVTHIEIPDGEEQAFFPSDDEENMLMPYAPAQKKKKSKSITDNSADFSMLPLIATASAVGIGFLAFLSVISIAVGVPVIIPLVVLAAAVVVCTTVTVGYVAVQASKQQSARSNSIEDFEKAVQLPAKKEELVRKPDNQEKIRPFADRVRSSEQRAR